MDDFIVRDVGLVFDLSNRDNNIPLDEIEVCEEWIKKYTALRKTINRTRGSYSLKHNVERWSGLYVSNGAFIQAAINQGYKIKPHDQGSHNCWFNMSFPRKGTKLFFEAMCEDRYGKILRKHERKISMLPTRVIVKLEKAGLVKRDEVET